MRRYWFLFLLLIPLSGWGMVAFGREVIIEPVAEWLWRFYLALQTVPQEGAWMGLMVVAGFNIVRLIMQANPFTPTPSPPPAMRGRLSEWLDMLRAAGQPGYWGKHISREVRKIVATHWAYRANQTPDEVMAHIWDGRLTTLSPAAQDFLGNHPKPIPPRQALALIEEIVHELEGGQKQHKAQGSD